MSVGGWLSGLVLAAVSLFGQAPAFEVASVRANTGNSGNSGMHRNAGRISLENYSLKQLIQMAYDVKDFSLAAPAWLEDYRFDVEAKPPSGGAESLGFMPPEFRAMLQTLLADRFKLAVRRESRVLAAYALLVDKKGPRLKPAVAGRGSGMSFGRGMAQGTNVPMAEFADILATAVGRPVKDMTKLPGAYDIKLTWTPDAAAGEPVNTAPTADGRQPNSLFTAVQEQLGLRLEGRKLPIEVLVVDHVEKVPTEN